MIEPPFLSPTVIRLPEIKPEPFYICLFASKIKLESAYTSMSLSYDFCPFIAIVVVEQTRGQRQTGRNDLPGKGERVASGW